MTKKITMNGKDIPCARLPKETDDNHVSRDFPNKIASERATINNENKIIIATNGNRKERQSKMKIK
jgi:hypothetical protein